MKVWVPGMVKTAVKVPPVATAAWSANDGDPVLTTLKWLAVGTSLLTNLVSLGGKSKRVKTTGMSSVLTKNRMENTAEQRKDALQAQLATLQQELHELQAPDPSRFERRIVKPTATDVAITRYDVVWAY